MPRDASSIYSSSGGPKLQAGQRVDGRYRLEEFLGRGGMGTVWRAHDETLDLPVALKFLHEMLLRDDQALAELKRETKRALQLTHPHIVRVYSLVDDKETGLACIAMEFVPGVNLTQRRMRVPRRVFEIEQIAAWVGQLCDALHYAHEKAHIIHRDLKPGNLLLDVDDDLKITDFGIAATANESITRLTGCAATGTLEYMSVQQAQGDRPTPADDLYALGATIYELLTGEPPFGFNPPYQALTQQRPVLLNERRRQLDLAEPIIPPEWEQTVAALLAKTPRERPASARDVARALQLHVPGAPKADATLDPQEDFVTLAAPIDVRQMIANDQAAIRPSRAITERAPEPVLPATLPPAAPASTGSTAQKSVIVILALLLVVAVVVIVIMAK
jgi:serine/threonine protein kinase